MSEKRHVDSIVSHEDSVRLHADWWGKCRTCRFWHGADETRSREGTTPLILIRWHDARCENPRSELRGEMTTTNGYCQQWDSFDVDVALSPR